jgi:four helix bundle protein
MRDHKKLRAFQLADALALAVCKATRRFPDDERFGLRLQLRRGAVSVASNIVEGCARPTQPDYLHLLGIAFGAACEVDYQLSLAHRLGYLSEDESEALRSQASETARVLNGLIVALRGVRRPRA